MFGGVRGAAERGESGVEPDGGRDWCRFFSSHLLLSLAASLRRGWVVSLQRRSPCREGDGKRGMSAELH